MTTSDRFQCAILSACITALTLTGPAHAETPSSLKDSRLGQYYAAVQSKLMAAGRLRRDPSPSDAPYGPSGLARNFFEIAMRHEYGTSGQKPLLRWEDPVRYSIRFGASVGPAQQRADHASISGMFSEIRHLTGHPIRQGGSANFHVFVLGEAELKGIAPILRQEVAGLSASQARSIARMPQSHMCRVVAVPHQHKSRGYRSVVAIIRAEHAPVMRASCIAEEIAQGMGLPNDCRTARPSIFNDDEEFAVLTHHDKTLLSMLYSPSLRSGMSAAEARPVVEQLSRLATR
ncbi:DUF2927 domain-containing protein [Aestuariibius insulae]|uniref:DUF2927 domain-containing protein n=1 Tax=Aestuariibius insulae TaxID=2058287 RepID=UPI00345E9FFB